MKVVDTHFHFWTPQTHPWVARAKDGGHPAGNFDEIQIYMVDDFLKDHEGFCVTKAVHVQAFYEGKPPEETRWLQAIADTTPTGIPHGIVGHCDLSGDEVESILQEHCTCKNMRGIRQLLNFHPDKPLISEANGDNYLCNPKWLEGLGLLQKYHLSFDLHVLPRQMQQAYEVVRKYPQIQFILDHCGLPYEKDLASRKLWMDGMRQLGSCDNVVVKLSGGFATDPQWTQESAIGLVKQTANLFGPNKSIFASNFPVDKVNGTYSQWMDVVLQAIGQYTPAEQQKIMAATALQVYRL